MNFNNAITFEKDYPKKFDLENFNLRLIKLFIRVCDFLLQHFMWWLLNLILNCCSFIIEWQIYLNNFTVFFIWKEGHKFIIIFNFSKASSHHICYQNIASSLSK